MKLKITLLSDLCTYSGETYNSTVDTEVVYDDYGFPYIPAKRLKGCIREAGLELAEWGCFPELEEIFGKEGNQASAFTLSNAYLTDYEKYIEDLKLGNDKVLTHPQNILRLFTYTRTQTSLDVKSGVAVTNTLRTMRVVKKGLTFEADIHFSKEEYKEKLEKAIQMVTHIGYQRTRGLGTVSMKLEKGDAIGTNVCGDAIGEKNKIYYFVKLLSPMLCKSAEGNQAKTLKYLEGSKVLGMLAGAMGQEKFFSLMKRELIVSNAYISADGKRCTPLRASLQKKKDQKFVNDQMEVLDMLHATPGEQVTSVGYEFADENGCIQNVATEINYHHKRPSDKSIGRATGQDDSAFYQLESIRKGQTFQGYILADKEQSEKIYDAVKVMKNIRMGYGRSSQYGAVEFSIDNIERLKEKNEQERVHDFQVKLNSAVIMYNENGMYVADVDTLKYYLEKAFLVETGDFTIGQTFLKYETIGGFNVTWKRRKPVFTALGKGTVLEVHSEKGIDVQAVENIFIGERVSEGFGEIEFTVDDPTQTTCILKKDSASKTGSNPDTAKPETDILQKLYKTACAKDIAETARKDATAFEKSRKLKKEADATISRLILISKEQHSYAAMLEQIEGIKNDDKHDMAKAVGDNIEAGLKKEFAYLDKLDPALSEDEIYRIYCDSYLKQMKYLLRRTREDRRDGNE